jgi:(1->4)-alpha-D-glucan 1-alpha-D-glucosylmutase
MSPLDELAGACGIALAWDDYRGERRVVADDTKRALLAAFGVLDAPDDAGVARAHAALREARWREDAPPVVVVRRGARCAFPCTRDSAHAGSEIRWRVTFENGAVRDGALTPGDVVERGDAGGRPRESRAVVVPVAPPPGYHRLELRDAHGLDARVEIIVVPERCYEPAPLREGERCWGIAAQLYALRSERDWGIGDFGALRRLVRAAAATGADFVGLNPLHALYPARPAQCSPYAPSSRLFLNVLYVDVEAVPELEHCEPARRMLADPAFVRRIAELRSGALVDYPAVAALKMPVLRELHAAFVGRQGDGATARGAAFRAFVAGRGEALGRHALYDALSAHFGGTGWQGWPEAYRDPEGEAVRQYAQAHADEVALHAYLQFVADEQLAAAQAEAHAAGMRIGLYTDLAVGVDAGGADAWAAQTLYRTGASVGAPPDPLALHGQDWGLPPVDPRALRARGYRDFAAMLRANMRHCGALRIDHVMSLLRLWCVPGGARADAGAYVGYPFEDLLGIVALESERNQCLVIGEDLGTVPDAIRDTLPAAAVHSYRVLWFEKHADGRFRAPHEYPRRALAVVTTHDLPTLASWWEGTDIALREGLGLYPSPDVGPRCRDERARDRQALLAALSAEGLLPDGAAPDRAGETPMTDALAEAVHAYLARGASALMAVQMEDLLAMRDAVNVPGTSTEHPNWRRRLTLEVEPAFANETVRRLCARIGAERGRGPRPQPEASPQD